MKLAPTPTSASYAASGAGRLARALRRCAAAGALAVLACGPALAQRHGDQHGDGRGQDPRTQDQRAQDQRAMPPQRQPEQPVREQRFDPRAFDSREFDDRRQQDPSMRGQEARRSGRMTPDERRDLRRQINEAGMDLYARPPRH
jgi:hypothetical protein